MNTQPSVPAFITHANLKCKKYLYWGGLTKLDETIGYSWCPIVMRWSLWLQQWSLWLHHYDVIYWDKQSCVTMAVDLCVPATWPLTCAFPIPCTHTPEIIDMHRDVCDKAPESYSQVREYEASIKFATAPYSKFRLDLKIIERFLDIPEQIRKIIYLKKTK